MGLCKCPKRKVTTQFCYEHKVNVCEYCMMNEHHDCIVKSYLKWLEDENYNAVCELCAESLKKEECVRLVCYHVFHWRCLNSFCETTTEQLACPTCKNGIIPQKNLVSPVADMLNEKLATTSWARDKLGLATKDAAIHKSEGIKVNKVVSSAKTVSRTEKIVNIGNIPSRAYVPDAVAVKIEDSSPYSRINAEAHRHYNESRAAAASSKARKFDRDDDKYKRRSLAERFSTWRRSYSARMRYFYFRTDNVYHRYLLLIAALFVVFLLFILAIDKFGGRKILDETEDSEFSPLMNAKAHISDE